MVTPSVCLPRASRRSADAPFNFASKVSVHSI